MTSGRMMLRFAATTAFILLQQQAAASEENSAATAAAAVASMSPDLQQFRSELLAALDVPEAVAIIRDLFAFLAQPVAEEGAAVSRRLAEEALERVEAAAVPTATSVTDATNAARDRRASRAAELKARRMKSQMGDTITTTGAAKAETEETRAVESTTVTAGRRNGRVPRNESASTAKSETTTEESVTAEGATSEAAKDVKDSAAKAAEEGAASTAKTPSANKEGGVKTLPGPTREARRTASAGKARSDETSKETKESAKVSADEAAAPTIATESSDAAKSSNGTEPHDAAKSNAESNDAAKSSDDVESSDAAKSSDASVSTDATEAESAANATESRSLLAEEEMTDAELDAAELVLPEVLKGHDFDSSDSHAHHRVSPPNEGLQQQQSTSAPSIGHSTNNVRRRLTIIDAFDKVRTGAGEAVSQALYGRKSIIDRIITPRQGPIEALLGPQVRIV